MTHGLVMQIRWLHPEGYAPTATVSAAAVRPMPARPPQPGMQLLCFLSGGREGGREAVRADRSGRFVADP